MFDHVLLSVLVAAHGGLLAALRVHLKKTTTAQKQAATDRQQASADRAQAASDRAEVTHQVQGLRNMIALKQWLEDSQNLRSGS